MVCENCEGSNDGSYGSGRFCSQKCARAFATKTKRDAINVQVSAKLQGRVIGGGQIKSGGQDKRHVALHRAGFFSSENQSRRRKNQIAAEVAIAKGLEQEGWKIFPPTVVCDRVGVKNGKVFFLEFKKPGQKLRPGQQEIHDLAPDMYEVVYG